MATTFEAGSKVLGDERRGDPRTRRIIGVALWVIQALLAALFLFAGGMKLVTSAEAMAKQMPFPVPFIRFIGVCEFLGGLGLVLPGLLRVRTGLTPLAAAGLVVIMVGAVVVSWPMGAAALLPLVTGILAAFVAYGRWRLAPLREGPRR